MASGLPWRSVARGTALIVAQEKGEGIVREEHRRTGWQGSDLPTQPKGARPKAAAALRLRKETTLTLRWIADRLEMAVGRRCPIC